MSNDNFENSWAMGQDEDSPDTITLTLEDDSELECLVLTTLEVNDKVYVALLPADSVNEDDEDGEVFLYRFIEKGEDDIELMNIESDEEFELVSEAFDQYMDSLEFDEVFGDEEE